MPSCALRVLRPGQVCAPAVKHRLNGEVGLCFSSKDCRTRKWSISRWFECFAKLVFHSDTLCQFTKRLDYVWIFHLVIALLITLTWKLKSLSLDFPFSFSFRFSIFFEIAQYALIICYDVDSGHFHFYS